MAEEEARPLTLKERMALLSMSQGGHQMQQTAPPSFERVTKSPPPSASVTAPRPRPPPPPVPVRPKSTTIPVNGTANGGIGNMPEQGRGGEALNGRLRPNLPPRTSTDSTKSIQSQSQAPTWPSRRGSEQTPNLPPRNPSTMSINHDRRPSDAVLSRKASQESVSSVTTTRSSMSAVSNATSLTSQSDRFTIKAPAYDPSTLPALPPKKTAEEKERENQAARRPLKSAYSTPNVPRRISATPATTVPPTQPSLPSRPDQPSTPARPALPQRNTQGQTQASKEPSPELPRRTLPPPPDRPKRSALSMGFDHKFGPPPNPEARPESVPPPTNAAPPPVPAASKPDLSALMASKPKPNGVTNGGPAGSVPSQGTCLHCRDFSAPDTHAARFPRQSLPIQDVGWLANQLCEPFPSHTDKARAIFTWLHHNVEYDVYSFFNKCVKPSTPQSTLASGLAVCEGYAGLFAAMALKAGLEAVVVSGASKGFGHEQWSPGQPIPQYEATHAWNAVRFDGGQWKLIDACWGAGHVQGAGGAYEKYFSPLRFTQTNEDFGRDHFPADASKQLRSDGRTLTWENFIMGSKFGTGAGLCTNTVPEEGLDPGSFEPLQNPIVLSKLPGPTIRFSFQKICPHWDPSRNGKGPGYRLFILALQGLDGTQRNHIPFNQGDGIWWLDVPVRDLGGPGMKVYICALTKFDGKDNVRGLTKEQYLSRKGRCAMSWSSVANWDTA